MLKITKHAAGFQMEVSPPYSLKAWKSCKPMSFKELMMQANELGIPAQDFYCAACEADPSVRNT